MLLTRRGIRKLAPVIALPREVRAVSKAVETIGSKTPELIRTDRPAEVERILSESYLQTVADMAIAMDPFISHWSRMSFIGAEGATTTPLESDFFKEQTGGAGGSGKPAVDNDLHEDNKPNHPCIVTNIGVFMSVRGPIGCLVNINALILEIWQGESRRLRIPLVAALTGVLLMDNAAVTPGQDLIDLRPNAGGGYEVEGEGLVLQRAETTTKVLLTNPLTKTFPDPGVPLDEYTFMLHLDGEKAD